MSQSFFVLLNLTGPCTFAVPSGELLHLPEPLLPEDGSPLVLEEDSDELKQVHRHTAIEPHSHVILAHVEAACRHASLHKHPLSGHVLADHLVNSQATGV